MARKRQQGFELTDSQKACGIIWFIIFVIIGIFGGLH
jgi:hypothetical protein